jgi:hypothetical protein
MFVTTMARRSLRAHDLQDLRESQAHNRSAASGMPADLTAAN